MVLSRRKWVGTSHLIQLKRSYNHHLHKAWKGDTKLLNLQAPPKFSSWSKLKKPCFHINRPGVMKKAWSHGSPLKLLPPKHHQIQYTFQRGKHITAHTAITCFCREFKLKISEEITLLKGHSNTSQRPSTIIKRDTLSSLFPPIVHRTRNIARRSLACWQIPSQSPLSKIHELRGCKNENPQTIT